MLNKDYTGIVNTFCAFLFIARKSVYLLITIYCLCACIAVTHILTEEAGITDDLIVLQVAFLMLCSVILHVSSSHFTVFEKLRFCCLFQIYVPLLSLQLLFRSNVYLHI